MTTEKPTTIDAYIAGFPADVRDILHQIRNVIRNAAPQAQESISYGMPAFKQAGPLVYFAAWEKHVGFYPAGQVAGFEDKLAGYERSKGTIRFPLDQPIPYDLITEITVARLEDNLAKAAAKSKK